MNRCSNPVTEQAEGNLHNGFDACVLDGPPGYTPDDFSVPTLDDVLAGIVDARLYVEVKAETPDAFVVAERVAEKVEAANRTDDVVVSSAHDGVVEVLQARHPEIDTARGWGRTATFWFGARAVDGTPRTGHEVLSAPHRLGGRTVVDDAFVDAALGVALAIGVRQRG